MVALKFKNGEVISSHILLGMLLSLLGLKLNRINKRCHWCCWLYDKLIQIYIEGLLTCTAYGLAAMHYEPMWSVEISNVFQRSLAVSAVQGDCEKVYLVRNKQEVFPLSSKSRKANYRTGLRRSCDLEAPGRGPHAPTVRCGSRDLIKCLITHASL